jgi:hypothetical protein
MSSKEPNIAIVMDDEQEELLIVLEAGEFELSSRLRPLEAWLLLYLLDPEWDGWSEAAEAFCEQAIANDPQVGLAQSGDEMLLSLPHGHLVIPASREPELARGLKEALAGYTDSLGIA